MRILHHPGHESRARLQPVPESAGVIFREATSHDDMLQIFALNHRTFAKELGQHPVAPSGLLVDRFHDHNRYFIAATGSEVVGMISVHSGPEYSVAGKLQDPGILRQFSNALEVRLLAIAPHARKRTLLAGLLWMVYEFAAADHYSHLLISGVVDREPMYRKLGFTPLGPAVQQGAASFIPMVMEIGEKSVNSAGRVASFERYWSRTHSRHKATVVLQPGPVQIHPAVKQSFHQELISHRSKGFLSQFEETQCLLRSLAPEFDVVMFPGSGTLANDVVAGNLRALAGNNTGLVISNGEFGERLAAQAERAGLVFDRARFDWGEPWDWCKLDNLFNTQPAWVWAVHLETSTGVLNDVNRLISRASQCGALVALDCVSSLGAVPMPAPSNSLHLMTSVSGKAIGSYAGIGIVYLSEFAKRLLKDKTLCASFDLIRMAAMHGPATTFPSPQLFALREALLQNYSSADKTAGRFRNYEALGKAVRQELRASGFSLLCQEEIAATTVTTFRLPEGDFPADCLRAGYRIAHESMYLQARQWAQVATMGDISLHDLDEFVTLLRSRRQREAALQTASGIPQS